MGQQAERDLPADQLTTSSTLLLLQGLLSLHLLYAGPALLQEPHTKLHYFLLLIAQARQQAAHQGSFILLEELGSHVLQQVCCTFESCLADFSFGIIESHFEGSLDVFEVASCSFCDEQPAESDESVLAYCVFVILEVFHEGLGDGCAVLPYNALHLCTQIVYELAGLLHHYQSTLLISAFGSSRHLERALASSGMWKLMESLKGRQSLRRDMIFSLRSSLFQGKGVLLMRWISAWIIGSDYYFLRVAFFSNFSKRVRVTSRLASIGSFRVYSKFLPRLVHVRTLI